MKLFALLHPAAAMFYFAGTAVCLFTSRNLSQLILAVAGLLAVAFFFAGKRDVYKILKWLVPMAALIVLFNPLFNRRGRTVLFYFLGSSFTLEAVLLGINQAILLAGLVLLFVSFNEVIEPPAFLYLTGKYLPGTALLLNLALQAGARLSRRAKDMLDVQKTRGTVQSKKSALQMLNAFTLRSLEEGMEMAGVLKAKDYGAARRTHYKKYLFKRRDGLALAVMLALLICPVSEAAFICFPLLMEAKGFVYGDR